MTAGQSGDPARSTCEGCFRVLSALRPLRSTAPATKCPATKSLETAAQTLRRLSGHNENWVWGWGDPIANEFHLWEDSKRASSCKNAAVLQPSGVRASFLDAGGLAEWKNFNLLTEETLLDPRGGDPILCFLSVFSFLLFCFYFGSFIRIRREKRRSGKY